MGGREGFFKNSVWFLARTSDFPFFFFFCRSTCQFNWPSADNNGFCYYKDNETYLISAVYSVSALHLSMQGKEIVFFVLPILHRVIVQHKLFYNLVVRVGCRGGVVVSILACRSEGHWFDFALQRNFSGPAGTGVNPTSRKWAPGAFVGKQRQRGEALASPPQVL